MPTAQQKDMAAAGSPYARHIPALDGIRGLAILAVMATHLFVGTPHTIAERVLIRMCAYGAHGVDLFFVLSGFLITGILYDSLGQDKYFRKFYARRALRIFPLYYATLALFAIVSLVLGLSYHGQLLSLLLYLQNTSLIAEPITLQTLMPHLPLVHFWTLAIEEQFYLAWPLVVCLVRDRRRLLWVCLLCLMLDPLVRVIAAHHGMDYEHRHINTLCRADSLLMGGALALLLRGPFHDRVLRAAPWMFVLGLLVGFGPSFVLPHVSMSVVGWVMGFGTAFDDTGLALWSVGVLGMALLGGTVKRLFTNPAMRWVGRYSYGIYVLHYILFAWLQVRLHGALLHVIHNKAVVVGVAGLLCAGMSMAVAYASFHLFEVRFLHFKKYFAYKRADVTATHS